MPKLQQGRTEQQRQAKRMQMPLPLPRYTIHYPSHVKQWCHSPHSTGFLFIAHQHTWSYCTVLVRHAALAPAPRRLHLLAQVWPLHPECPSCRW